jgi:protein O-GlcNAc transferase
MEHVLQAIALPPEAGIPPQRIRRALAAQPDLARAYAVLAATPLGSPGDNGVRAAMLAPTEPAYLVLAAVRRLATSQIERAEDLARRASVINPMAHEATLVLSEGHRSLGDPDRALTLARRALATAPHDPKAWVTGAVCAYRLSNFGEARHMAEAASILRPRDAGHAARAATLLPHITMSEDEMWEIRARIRDLCTREGFAPIRDPIQEVGTVPFALGYHGINDRDLLVDLCAFYRRICPMLTMTAPHIGRRRRPGKRRVAFVSEFFRDHSIYNMTEGHLRMIDRDEIEVTVVQIGPLPSPMHDQIARLVDRVVVLPSVLETVRARLAEMELDSIVFADIGMTAMSYFLPFARLAPQQIVLPGHPVTTGIDTVDLFFTSAWMEPDNCRDHYSETPILVEGLAIAYAEERTRHTPVSRSEVGLPESGAIYLCGQTPLKMHPAFDRMLGDILEQDPTGTLALFDAPGIYSKMTKALLERLAHANADRPRIMDRIRLLPRLPLDRYLGVMLQADVVLDTLHFNGGNTSMQSLALGQPLVTYPTDMMRGRVTLSPLIAMGMRADLEATSPDDYVARALDIARDRERAEDLRLRLTAAAPALIDSDIAPRALSKLILDAEA